MNKQAQVNQLAIKLAYAVLLSDQTSVQAKVAAYKIVRPRLAKTAGKINDMIGALRGGAGRVTNWMRGIKPRTAADAVSNFDTATDTASTAVKALAKPKPKAPGMFAGMSPTVRGGLAGVGIAGAASAAPYAIEAAPGLWDGLKGYTGDLLNFRAQGDELRRLRAQSQSWVKPQEFNNMKSELEAKYQEVLKQLEAQKASPGAAASSGLGQAMHPYMSPAWQQFYAARRQSPASLYPHLAF